MKSCNIAAYPIAKARGLRGGFSVIESLIKCRQCIYRAPLGACYTCDYVALTGQTRGGKAEDCTVFVKGPRLKEPKKATSRFNYLDAGERDYLSYLRDTVLRQGAPIVERGRKKR